MVDSKYLVLALFLACPISILGARKGQPEKRSPLLRAVTNILHLTPDSNTNTKATTAPNVVDFDPSSMSQTIHVDLSTQPEGPVETNKIKMDPVDIIEYQGFPAETHNVITKDFYNLTMFRIPNEGKPPIYVLHGVLCTARDFLVQPGNDSLPFKLHEAGYDVWVGNIRGNSYANGHLNYSTDDVRYWNYSNDEIIKYDNPAVIDYILNVTQQPKLGWIGYSLGNYVFLGTMALFPEYNDKVFAYSGLAPPIYFGNITSPFRLAAPFADESNLAGILDQGAFTPEWMVPIIGLTLPAACMPQTVVGAGACVGLLQSLLGYDFNETSKAILPVAFHTFPNTISALAVRQILKDIFDPNFRFFDYGTPSANMAVYNSTVPPKYDVSKITVPTMLYSGLCDTGVVVKDTDRLANDLACPPKRRYVENFNHFDFIYGRHAPQFYDLVIQDINYAIANDQPCTA